MPARSSIIVNARSAAIRNEQIVDLRGEVDRLEFEVLKGEKNLVRVRNALDDEVQELVRTEGRARELIEEIQRFDTATRWLRTERQLHVCVGDRELRIVSRVFGETEREHSPNDIVQLTQVARPIVAGKAC